MEYATPVRVFWEVDGVDAGAYRILDDLAACRVFFVALAFRGAVDADLVRAAAERLAPSGTRLTVEGRPERGIEAAAGIPGVQAVHLDVTDDELPPSAELGRFRAALGTAAGGLKLELWGRHVPRVPALLDAAHGAGIRRVVLANPRVVEGACHGPADALRHAQHAALEAALEARRAWLSEIDAIIHDLFVWKLFARFMEHPPTRGEYAGCQAYNALAYVGPTGLLYGCQTLQKPLGSLHEQRLEALWGSPARRLIRRMLEQNPEVCRSCVHFAECRSGCRGIVEFIHGDFDEADPSCPFYAPATAGRS